MKRLTFTPQMADQVRAGCKTVTTRKLTCPIEEGDEFAAVESGPGKPGFLVPAKDAFAICRCVCTALRSPNSMSDAEAVLEGFGSKAEYLAYWQKLNPTTPPDAIQKVITFEVVR